VVSPSPGDDREPCTTSGTIAVVNLHAQIDGLKARASRSEPAERLVLIGLLTLRGHVLGRIADYEQAAALAEHLVGDLPEDAIAVLARARTRATFHRFDEALADLASAELRGLDRSTLEAERATILQAVGRHAEARELYLRAMRRRPDFAALGALAVLHAEHGDVIEAERLFTEARRQHRGTSTSPFPIASLDFRRGLMWFHEGDLPAARSWFDASLRRVPAYAPALGRLAEIDAAQGDHEAAADRLRPLASTSDDPAYAAGLGWALDAAGHHAEAGQQLASAAARYEELAQRHPDAYADHAADFRRRARRHPGELSGELSSVGPRPQLS
jgi:tetratricopeptide (TPR) repeat protein